MTLNFSSSCLHLLRAGLAGMCSHHTLFLWSLVLYTLGIHCTTCSRTLPPQAQGNHQLWGFPEPILFSCLLHELSTELGVLCIVCVCRTGNLREAVQPWRLRQFFFSAVCSFQGNTEDMVYWIQNYLLTQKPLPSPVCKGFVRLVTFYSTWLWIIKEVERSPLRRGKL